MGRFIWNDRNYAARLEPTFGERRWDGVDRQNDAFARWGREARAGDIECKCGKSSCRTCNAGAVTHKECAECGTSRAQSRYYIVGRDGERDDVCIPCRKQNDHRRRKKGT
jgi:hypothetical protein